MTETIKKETYVEEQKEDAREFLEVLEKVPQERKGEVLGIVRGFALCAENPGKKVG